MEAILIYNPNAGGSSEDQARILQTELMDIGYKPVYRATQREEELDAILPEAQGLVVVVGGDGTLRAVATRMVDRPLPIALIPNGTANNVGRTLGIEGHGDPIDIVRRLANPIKRPVDLGRMTLPWGATYFMEGAGMGLFAEALATYKPEDGKSFLRGAKTLVDMMATAPSHHFQLRLDGREEEGDYLLLEAMNMGAIGPRIPVAPSAKSHDGLLDVVRIDAERKDSYFAYLSALVNDELAQLDSVLIDRVKKVEFRWNGFPIHQDASYIDMKDKDIDLEDAWVSIDLLPNHLEFWLPEPVAKDPE